MREGARRIPENPDSSEYSFLESETGQQRRLTDIRRPVDFPTDKMAARIARTLSQDRGRLRDTESGIQNRYLRAKRTGSPLPVDRELKEAVYKAGCRDNLLIARTVDSMRRGIEGMEKALSSLDRRHVDRHGKDRERFVGLNDYLDAKYMIDAVQIVPSDDGDGIEEIELVQVKNTAADEAERRAIQRAHQEYVDSLMGALEARSSGRLDELRKRRKEFAERIRHEDKEATKEVIDRYDLFVINMTDKAEELAQAELGDDDVSGLIQDTKDMSLLEVSERFREPEVAEYLRKLFVTLAGAEGEEQEKLTAAFRSLERWAQTRQATPGELADAVPDMDLPEGGVTVRRIRSVIIENGIVTEETPLTAADQKVLIKS